MKSDILIIGGGLTGCATAYYLAREGADVALVERAQLNGQASGANAGSIHAQIPHEPFVSKGEEWANAFAPAIPVMMESIALWRELPTSLGVDLEFAAYGGLIVAETEAQMREIEAKAAIERRYGLPVDLLSRDDLRKLAPYVSERMIGGAFCPIEGKANPLLATPALASAAEQAGARIHLNTGVSAINRDDEVYRVATSKGTMRARRIVNCAGADAGDIARLIGVDLPIERHPIQVSVTAPMPPLIKQLVYSAGERLSLKQTARGALLIGGGWPSLMDAATGKLSINAATLRENLAAAARVAPATAKATLVRTWPAIVNGTDDWKPVIDEIAPGFFLAMFPWMGFTAGPITAKIVAGLVLGRKTERDLSLFSAERWRA